MKKRDIYQSNAINALYEKIKENALHLSEIPTGGGKSKILLETASKFIKAHKRSIIISTANNFLALEMLEEGKKFNLFDNMELLIGKDNYIDTEILLSESFLQQFSLSKNAIKEWMKTNSKTLIISSFLEHFDLPDGVGELLCRDASERSVANDVVAMEDFPRIYVTNHFYLISLLDKATPNTLDAFPFLVDEVHLLNNVARVLYKTTFSPFRLRYLLSGLISKDLIAKAHQGFARQIIARMDAIISMDSSRKDSTDALESIKATIAPIVEKEKITELIKSIERKTRKEASYEMGGNKFKKEIYEMRKIYYSLGGRMKDVRISYSMAKRYPTISLSLENPIAKLRAVLSRHLSPIIGVSGTIRVSKDESMAGNLWSFERIGFWKYNTPSNESELSFNARVDYASFSVAERVFCRDQARYYIAEEERFAPPKMDKKNNSLFLKKYERWIANQAELINTTAWGNTVVLMSSFENIEMLYSALVEIGVDREYCIMPHRQGVSLRQVVREYKESVDNGKQTMLICGLGGYTGIDFYGDYLNTLHIGKLPLEVSKNFFFKSSAGSFSNQLSHIKNGLLTFRQGMGRAIRSHEDRALIVIGDSRIKKHRYRDFLYFVDEYGIKIER